MAIIEAVASLMKSEGYIVEMIGEDELIDGLSDKSDGQAWNVVIASNVIFSMARHEEVLSRLSILENNGCAVVNPSSGVIRCRRDVQTSIFNKRCVATPISSVVSLNGINPDDELPIEDVVAFKDLVFPLWVKRGDACAQVSDDVVFVENQEQLESVLQRFRYRGISSAVLSSHVVGDLVKFYGVEGTDFFYWSYADVNHGKFGLERINGLQKQFPFDEKCLQSAADEASKAVGVPVYGGDAIITEKGAVRIIDFNDWPSFSSCRDDAAKAICERIKFEINILKNKIQ